MHIDQYTGLADERTGRFILRTSREATMDSFQAFVEEYCRGGSDNVVSIRPVSRDLQDLLMGEKDD